MAVKNRFQFDNEILDLIKFRDMNKVRNILLLEFRRTKFSELTIEQLNRAIELLESAIENGEI